MSRSNGRLPEHIARALERAQVPVVRIERTGGGHIRLVTAGGAAVTASTPSCPYADRKVAADLRRAGGVR